MTDKRGQQWYFFLTMSPSFLSIIQDNRDECEKCESGGRTSLGLQDDWRIRHTSRSEGGLFSLMIEKCLKLIFSQISRVNCGSKAAEKVREGDFISCINGTETNDLTHQVHCTYLHSNFIKTKTL